MLSHLCPLAMTCTGSLLSGQAFHPRFSSLADPSFPGEDTEAQGGQVTSVRSQSWWLSGSAQCPALQLAEDLNAQLRAAQTLPGAPPFPASCVLCQFAPWPLHHSSLILFPDGEPHSGLGTSWAHSQAET